MNSLNELQLKEQLLKKLTNHIHPSLTIALIKTISTIGITQYMNSIQKICTTLNIHLKIYNMQNQSEQTILALINTLNNDYTINGIIICLPLAPNLNQEKILNQISPTKDIDCLTNQNLEKINLHKFQILPSLVSAIIELLTFNHITIKNKNILILNKTTHLGLPLGKILTYHKAHTKVCNSKTPNITNYLKKADLIIIATNKPIKIENKNLKPGVTLIDINEIKPNYHTFTNIKNLSTNIGPITILKLIENLITLTKK